MDCPSIARLAEYRAETLSPAERERLGAHIETCARCRAELRALAKVTRMVEALPAPPAPAHLWAGVAARIEARPRRAPLCWWKWAAGFGLAASLLLGIIAARTPSPELPSAPAQSVSYIAQHELLSARDSLADRASLGVLLASQRGHE